MADATNNICTACGWFSAIISCIAFGSFAVPIKSKAARECHVDPLVFQSYKTFMCLVTAILTPPLFGQDYYFTPYGIVSGLFWVPAGVAAVHAVQNAGLALSQGLWSSIIVLVSFVWGIFVFRESVRSKAIASVAVFLMCAGLWGMSYFSTPVSARRPTRRDGNLYQRQQQQEECVNYDSDGGDFLAVASATIGGTDDLAANDHEQDGTGEMITTANAAAKKSSTLGLEGVVNLESDQSDRFDDDNGGAQSEIHGFQQYDGGDCSINADDDSYDDEQDSCDTVQYTPDEIMRRRKIGMASAAFTGIWGGSIMVPMHFASLEASGIGYVVSFAIGASIVTIFLWILRFFHCWYTFRHGHNTSNMGLGTGIRMGMVEAYNLLPSMHFRVMWAPGGLAGTLWSIGNIASMVSVQNLGEGVGYSVTQASMLCSGLWGIFYLNEVVSLNMRVKWLTSAIITLIGILILSFEHVS